MWPHSRVGLLHPYPNPHPNPNPNPNPKPNFHVGCLSPQVYYNVGWHGAFRHPLHTDTVGLGGEDGGGEAGGGEAGGGEACGGEAGGSEEGGAPP